MKDKRLKYSNLRDVKISPYEVTGKVDVKVLKSKSERDKSRNDVFFRTKKNPGEAVERPLRDALAQTDIRTSDVDPSVLRQYGMMILFMAVLIAVFITAVVL